MPFPNPGGRPKQKAFHDALRRELAKVEGDTTRLEAVAETLVNTAIAGDIFAIKEIANRIDGKSDENVNMRHEAGAGFLRLLQHIEDGLAERMAHEPQGPASLRNGGVAGHA